jgi:DNA-directed RNA polymerase specialized sigma subunit
VLGPSGADGKGPAPPAGSTTCDPARLVLWTEFHEKVATLSEQERAVCEMHYYLDLTQAEIARVLELHPHKVSYLWIAATEKLGEGLDADL